jgi:hypothetical protein
VLPENHNANKVTLTADLLNVPNNLKKHTLANKNTRNNRMNKILLVLIFLTGFANAQTIIQYDYMETWTWPGLWNTSANTGWYTNASVSSNQSAALTGGGNGTSVIEDNWYRLPNVTGLDPTKQYQFRFRLASYTFSNTGAATRGVDAADYVAVQVSTNGAAYVNELRITGNSNATWPYTATGTITHTANGTFTNSAAPGGDVYQAPSGASTTGPSTITLNLSAGITQVAVDIYCRVNSAGEEWWLDNIELWDMTPVGLPIELISFDGTNTNIGNFLIWKTASEHNTSYYEIQKMQNGIFKTIAQTPAAGNSNELLTYTFVDNDFDPQINYYQLVQHDNDGYFETFGPISVDNTKQRVVVKVINMLGQTIDPQFESGSYIEIYNDGTMKKVIR